MLDISLYQGDCLDVLKTLPDASVDAVVTDPPYGLGFMGKKWDYDIPSGEVWAECLRVLKPGGHLLAFAGTRTQHRMAARIEDAGFEIRDMIVWVYGSGFPKSLDVSKAIDKAAGAVREVVGLNLYANRRPNAVPGDVMQTGLGVNHAITSPATPEARQWQGWGTALKPALEPITLARKPLAGTVAANVLAHGTGALNIDGCRVDAGGEENPSIARRAAAAVSGKTGGDMASALRAREGLPGWNKDIGNYVAGNPGEALGRWPANLIHDGSDGVVGLFPNTGASNVRPPTGKDERGVPGFTVRRADTETRGHNDNGGSAARFFYCAKASKRDRNEGCESMPLQVAGGMSGRRDGSMGSTTYNNNTHPTVKPTDLMRYLCRLITPPGGVVLDPFMGSGSTGKAAYLEGFKFIGIELNSDYLQLAEKRINHVAKQVKLF